MSIMFEVPSCREYFVGRPSHPGRFASYLFTELRGQTKVISTVKTTLNVAAYATPETSPSLQHIKYANQALGDVKTVLNIAKLPGEVVSFKRHCVETDRIFRDFRTHYINDEPIERDEWVEAATKVTCVLKKGLSVLGDAFFKPIVAIGRFAPLGRTGKTIKSTWKGLSIFKSGVKIVNCFGKLHLGAKNPGRKSVELFLEMWDLSYEIVYMHGSSVHPLARIILSVCKSVTALVEVWLKTA